MGAAPVGVTSHGAALAGALARADEDDDDDEEDVGPQLPPEQRPGGSAAIKYDSKAYVASHFYPSLALADHARQVRQHAAGRGRRHGSIRRRGPAYSAAW